MPGVICSKRYEQQAAEFRQRHVAFGAVFDAVEWELLRCDDLAARYPEVANIGGRVYRVLVTRSPLDYPPLLHLLTTEMADHEEKVLLVTVRFALATLSA